MPSAPLVPIGLDAVPASLVGGVVAIGNFDGVHRGHAVLLGKAVDAARARSAPALVLTFEPHPRTLFRPAEPVFRLSPLRAKAFLLTAIGIDGMVVAGFDRAFAAIPAEVFTADILAGRLKVAEVVVGHDFRFGRGRAGDAATLAGEGRRLGFAVNIIGQVSDGRGTPISSSAIRAALGGGNVREAERLLGHRWLVTGEVIPGEKRGRELGFPTANIRLGDDCRLRHGIYAVTVSRRGGTFGGVASYGRRPTFDNGAPLLEVMLFDFAGSLYGEELAVSFVDWIRPELRFEGIGPLVEAMNRDVEAARSILAGEPPVNPLDLMVAALARGEVVGTGSIV